MNIAKTLNAVPIIFLLSLQLAEGIQIFLELVDNDFTTNEHDLIDRFIINITSFEQAQGSYLGI